MAKHPRKRQKTRKPTPEGARPLGSHVFLTDEVSKDDEERRLESFLFGTPFVPSGKENKNLLVLSDHDEDGEPQLGDEKELGNLLDADLFFVDDGAPSTVKNNAALDVGLDMSNDSDHLDGSEFGQPQPHSDNEQEDGKLETQPGPSLPLQSKSRKPPAWVDPDDTTLQVSLASNKRLRKLRDAPSDDAVGGCEYERRLRRQYQRINPTPDWALTARQKLHPAKAKRRRLSHSSASQSDADDSEQDIMSGLLSSTNGIIRSAKKSTKLAQGTLAVERLRDANQSVRSGGHVKTVQFHPSPQVPVLLSASSDRRLSLFNIDGHTNPHLQTLHIPTLPLTNAVFHPTGSSVLLTGPRPFYYTYDLQSGATHRSPRGLWGTTFSGSNPLSQDSSMEICAFNSTGEILAVAGRCGYVHLVDWNSGAGQVVGSLKMNAAVKALWWERGGSGEGRRLMSLSQDAQVYLWDVGERSCINRWRDDGEFGSLVMSGDPAGKYLAIGAKTGFVNVYGQDNASSSRNEKPRLLKAIGNLTTPISTLCFNHDSQLLAMASNSKKDQMRLIHLPSLTAFANWPTSSTPLSHVTSIDFSAGSDYIAIGNNRGHVLLYHLKGFGTQ